MNKLLSYVHGICLLSTYINISNINTQSDYLWVGRLWVILVFYSFFAHLDFLTVQKWTWITFDNKNNNRSKKKKKARKHNIRKVRFIQRKHQEWWFTTQKALWALYRLCHKKSFMRGVVQKRIWFAENFSGWCEVQKVPFPPRRTKKLFLLPSF